MGNPPIVHNENPQPGDHGPGASQQGIPTAGTYGDQGGQPPPAYVPGAGSAPPFIPAQPQQHQFHQGQSQVQYVQQPDGTVQAIHMVQPTFNGLMPPQPVIVMAQTAPPQNPGKGTEPTIVINNTSQQQTAVAQGSSTTDSCLAGACGACMACMFCCTIM